MKMKSEYKEPEFKAVIFDKNDILTTSILPEGNLGRVTDDWEEPEIGIEI